jgi:hypothetical protein
MSTNTLNTTLIPMTEVGQGGRMSPLAKLRDVLSAFSTGRSAAAEYRRQIAMGVEPAKAIQAAFAEKSTAH